MNDETRLDEARIGADALSPLPRQHYRVRFREGARECTAVTGSTGLQRGDLVMVRTTHGPEPATISARLFAMAAPPCQSEDRNALMEILRPATDEERSQLDLLLVQEQEAFAFCQSQVEHLRLLMKLVRVERFFDGSKIIFYFTADNRVDFRELVKLLVRQYHTRIEMRQIGVRHETQMLGGLGVCGRELCCSAFLEVFDSVSIKMAKAQDLPLNPGKISGNCNRLLCCLTYEYEQYRESRRQMPKPGRTLRLGHQVCQVVQQHPLTDCVTVITPEGQRRTLRAGEWRSAVEEGLAASGTFAAPPEAPDPDQEDADPAELAALVDSADRTDKATAGRTGSPGPRSGRRRKAGKSE